MNRQKNCTALLYTDRFCHMLLEFDNSELNRTFVPCMETRVEANSQCHTAGVMLCSQVKPYTLCIHPRTQSHKNNSQN